MFELEVLTDLIREADDTGVVGGYERLRGLRNPIFDMWPLRPVVEMVDGMAEILAGREEPSVTLGVDNEEGGHDVLQAEGVELVVFEYALLGACKSAGGDELWALH